MTVDVYTAPSCNGCKLTTGRFDRDGVPYQKLPAEEHRDYLTSLGYSQLPVVVAGDQKWSGFRPDKIAKVTKDLLG